MSNLFVYLIYRKFFFVLCHSKKRRRDCRSLPPNAQSPKVCPHDSFTYMKLDIKNIPLLHRSLPDSLLIVSFTDVICLISLPSTCVSTCSSIPRVQPGRQTCWIYITQVAIFFNYHSVDSTYVYSTVVEATCLYDPGPFVRYPKNSSL